MSSLESRLKSRPITNPHMRAFLNLMVTGAWLQGRMNSMLKPYGITEPQYNVLRILRGQHGAAMNLYEIGDRMVYPTSNVSRIVDKLLTKEYVVRQTCEGNRRRVDISITDAGLGLLDDLQPVFDESFQEFVSKLSVTEAIRLSEALEALRD
jgi:DNA-binding MarR family transcriptional regulator